MFRQKENDISNFSSLLKKLEMDNVNVNQLRLLKSQHTYLEKLRSQRQKIEQLKRKFDESQQSAHNLRDQNTKLKSINQDLQRTVDMLKHQYDEQNRKRLHLQSLVSRQVEFEKEKSKHKMNQLICQIEQLRKNDKIKEMRIFAIEEQFEMKIQQLKQHFCLQRKRITEQWEQKIKKEREEKGDSISQIQELRQLVTRQNRALKNQNMQFQELSDVNQKLSESLQQNQLILQQTTTQYKLLQQKIEEYEETIKQMQSKLNCYQQTRNKNSQMDELRKRMGDLARGEIQRIQFIVNDFQ